MEGKKVRGSDSQPNFVLIDSQFYKVTPDLVSFEFILNDKAENHHLGVLLIGYSRHTSEVYVKLRGGDKRLYGPVNIEGWQLRYEAKSLQDYFINLHKLSPGVATNEDIYAVANEYVLDHLLKLEHYKARTLGLWATDQPDKVIDPDGVLFQIQ